MTTTPASPERKTMAEVKAAIARIDAAIAAAELRTSQFQGADWHSFMEMKQQRHELHLLQIARRVECCKKIVSLDRWLHGFDAVEAAPAAADITRAAG